MQPIKQHPSLIISNRKQAAIGAERDRMHIVQRRAAGWPVRENGLRGNVHQPERLFLGMAGHCQDLGIWAEHKAVHSRRKVHKGTKRAQRRRRRGAPDGRRRLCRPVPLVQVHDPRGRA